MKTNNINEKQNFLSVDGKTARNSYGDFFNVGEEVSHQDQEAGRSVILRFEAKKIENEITAYTSEGYAHLDFLVKFPVVEIKVTGLSIIELERARQLQEEGWSEKHDQTHIEGELAMAAACYALLPKEREKYSSWSTRLNIWFPRLWPWDIHWWKPSPNNRIKELAKAGALVAAEIDRLLTITHKQ